MKYVLEALVLLAIPLAGVAAAWVTVKRGLRWRRLKNAKWRVGIHTAPTKINVQIEKQGEDPIVVRELNRSHPDLDSALMEARAAAENTAETMNLE